MADLGTEDLHNKVKLLEAEIEQIRERNLRVEADKAWETSHFRVLFILGITYAITTSVFLLIAVPKPLLNALIPTIGYYLSTQSLPFVKHWWLRSQSKKD